MFRQVKSAIFWTLVYKFRKRLTIVAVLLSIVLLSQWIYTDVVEYLQLTQQLQYLSLLLPIKWIVILFNIGFSAYLILTIFKPSKEEQKNIKRKEEEIKEVKKTKETISNKELSSREKEFLTKKLRNESEILMDK